MAEGRGTATQRQHLPSLAGSLSSLSLAVAAAASGQRAVPSSLNDHAAQARFKYDGTCRWPYQAASLSAFTLALPNQCKTSAVALV